MERSALQAMNGQMMKVTNDESYNIRFSKELPRPCDTGLAMSTSSLLKDGNRNREMMGGAHVPW